MSNLTDEQKQILQQRIDISSLKRKNDALEANNQRLREALRKIESAAYDGGLYIEYIAKKALEDK